MQCRLQRGCTSGQANYYPSSVIQSLPCKRWQKQMKSLRNCLALSSWLLRVRGSCLGIYWASSLKLSDVTQPWLGRLSDTVILFSHNFSFPAYARSMKKSAWFITPFNYTGSVSRTTRILTRSRILLFSLNKLILIMCSIYAGGYHDSHSSEWGRLGTWVASINNGYGVANSLKTQGA